MSASYRDGLPLWPVTTTRPDGTEFTSSVHALTSTDAVTLISRRYPGLRVRLHTSPAVLSHAAYAVAREYVENDGDWREQGFVMVRDAVDHARNSLRLPESPPVAGAYPLEDEGTDLDTAFRVVLEATPDELESITREGSVRLRGTQMRAGDR